MKNNEAITTFSQSEKIKAGLIWTTQAIEILLCQVYIRFTVRIKTLESVALGGNMTGNTYIGHVWCFVEIMACRQAPSSHVWTDHMAVTAGSVTSCTTLIVTINLMLWKLVKISSTTQAASQGYNPLHACSIMQTGGEGRCNVLMT